jgi:type I restriction enzyme, S subunit
MEPRKLPQGWLRAKLSDVIEPRGEKALPSELPDLPFLGMDHVEAHTTRILGSVPASSMKSSAARFFTGDVLYGRLRPYLNKVAQPNFHGLASAEFIVFPDTELLHSKFLHFRLNAADFVSFASHLNEGDRPRVNFDQIGEFELLVPPPAEQHRIVAKIEELFSELDQGVASLKAAREQLKVYRQSLLKNAFEGKLTAAWRAAHRDQLETAAALQQRIAHERQARHQQQLADWQTAGQSGSQPKAPKPLPPLTAEELAELPELPAGWGWVSIEWLLSIDRKPMATGPFGTLLSKSDHRQTGLPVLGIENIGNGVFTKGNKIFVSEQKAKELEPFRVAAGDVVISRSGTVGEICKIPEGLGRAFISTNLIRVTLNRSVISEDYFVYLFQGGGSVKQQVKSLCKGSSREFLNQGILSAIAFPLPCIQEQREILSVLDAKLSEADQLDQTLATALQQADALRQSILKKAFHGQLVEQAKNEEPPTALLERIRAARSAPQPARRGRSARSSA